MADPLNDGAFFLFLQFYILLSQISWQRPRILLFFFLFTVHNIIFTSRVMVFPVSVFTKICILPPLKKIKTIVTIRICWYFRCYFSHVLSLSKLAWCDVKLRSALFITLFFLQKKKCNFTSHLTPHRVP